MDLSKILEKHSSSRATETITSINVNKYFGESCLSNEFTMNVLVSWCNGSIVDFESIDGGSIPPETVNVASCDNFFFGETGLFISTAPPVQKLDSYFWKKSTYCTFPKLFLPDRFLVILEIRFSSVVICLAC